MTEFERMARLVARDVSARKMTMAEAMHNLIEAPQPETDEGKVLLALLRVWQARMKLEATFGALELWAVDVVMT